jgi:hypothetical protein
MSSIHRNFHPQTLQTPQCFETSPHRVINHICICQIMTVLVLLHLIKASSELQILLLTSLYVRADQKYLDRIYCRKTVGFDSLGYLPVSCLHKGKNWVFCTYITTPPLPKRTHWLYFSQWALNSPRFWHLNAEINNWHFYNFYSSFVMITSNSCSQDNIIVNCSVKKQM